MVEDIHLIGQLKTRLVISVPYACFTFIFNSNVGFAEGMTPAQLAVMEPPYNLRMNRPSVHPESGEVVEPEPRDAFKIEFDEKVFGTKYY